MVSQTGDYPNTRAVIWMGTESSGRSQRMIDDAGGMQVDLRMFSALMTPPASWKWKSLDERYFDLVAMPASFYTGTSYDAAWLIALSIIQTGSTDASTVTSIFPEVASNYYGATGWVDLNENGDRKPGIFDIWGFTDTGFQAWGQYDGIQDTVDWYDDLLADAGITRPGPP